MRAANLLATLVGVTLLAAPAVQGQDSKEKDKAQGKAKPPARSFTDEDLKKYKAKPSDVSAPADAGSEGTSSEPEASPRRKRARESGGYQEPEPPSPAETEETEAASEPSAATAARSPEEAEWRARAASARRPQKDAQARIAGIESQMADLRDQLNPMSTRYVLGGNSTAGPGQIYEIEEKLRNLGGELVGAKADLAEAERSWQQFLDEARAAGVLPAWLQP